MEKIIQILDKYRLIIIFLVLFIPYLLFYPIKYVNVDEHDYILNSRNIIEGTLHMDCNKEGYSVSDFCVSKYNIGTSVFLVPSMLISENLTFLTTFIFFFLSIVIFDKLLQIYGIKKIYLFYFAFFPAFIYFIRTVFSEPYSLFLLLLSVYLLESYSKNNKNSYLVLLGITLSTLAFVRYSLIPVDIVFVLYLLLKFKKKALVTIASALPFIIAFLVFNNYMYGNPLRSGYYYSKEEISFSLTIFLIVLPKYLISLNVIYPFMLIGAFFSKISIKKLILSSTILLLLYYSLTGLNAYVFEGRILDLILGVRFYIPIIPLIMLLYFEVIQRRFKIPNILHLLSISGLILVSIAIHIVHNNFLLSI